MAGSASFCRESRRLASPQVITIEAVATHQEMRAESTAASETRMRRGPVARFFAEASPWKMVWVALFIRIAYMTFAHTWRVRPYGGHFQFGWEMARIARALVTGYGYADPFNGHTGPTAWVTPAFPLIIAGVFKLTGIYTPLSAWLLLAIDCVFSALIVRNVWEIANRCFNPSVARWSAWIWALYPRGHAIRGQVDLGDDADHVSLLLGAGAGAAHARHRRAGGE